MHQAGNMGVLRCYQIYAI